MNGKREKAQEEQRHRFHDCRTDAARWRRLDEILVLDALEDEAIRQQMSQVLKKLDRILAVLAKLTPGGDTAAALTKAADDVDATSAELQQSVDQNTPEGQ